MTTKEKLTRLLAERIGGEFSVYDALGPEIEGTLAFHSTKGSNLNPRFEQMSERPLYQTKVGEFNACNAYAIERCEGFIIFLDMSIVDEDARNVQGEALLCHPNTATERKFIEAAMAEVFDSATKPLLEAITAARNACIRFPQTYLQRVREA